MFDRVVVPLDGSALGEAVLPWVRRLAEERGGKVYLVHVVAPTAIRPAEVAYGGFVPVPYAPAGQDQPADGDRRGRGYLERIAATFAAPPRTVGVVRHGEPAAEIVAVAQQVGADLIAMSTHGRTGLPRLVLGSVADQVVRDCGLPVVLIRPKGPARREKARAVS